MKAIYKAYFLTCLRAYFFTLLVILFCFSLKVSFGSTLIAVLCTASFVRYNFHDFNRIFFFDNNQYIFLEYLGQGIQERTK